MSVFDDYIYIKGIIIDVILRDGNHLIDLSLSAYTELKSVPLRLTQIHMTLHLSSHVWHTKIIFKLTRTHMY